jgi:hypothetical protein
MTAGATVAPPGWVTLYTLVDVGETIDLASAERGFAEGATSRRRPRRLEAQTIRIPEPPLIVALASPEELLAQVPIGWRLRTSACLYDFGVISLHHRLEWPAAQPWADVRGILAALIHRSSYRSWAQLQARELAATLGGALREPEPVTTDEDHAVIRGRASPEWISEDELAWLLGHEARPLAPGSRDMLLGRDFRYTTDDRTVVAYDAALVIEPDPADEDVEFLLEFANAQLLELKVYDGLLDVRLPALEARAGSLSARPWRGLSRQFQPLLMEFHSLTSTTARLMERADNALRITDDIFLARIYRAALEVMNEPAWRRSVERKLTLARDSAESLNALSSASRTEFLEAVIVLLIVAELLLALF